MSSPATTRFVFVVSFAAVAAVACTEVVPPPAAQTPIGTSAEPEGDEEGAIADAGVDTAKPKGPAKPDGGTVDGSADGNWLPDLPVDPTTGCFLVDDAPIVTRHTYLQAVDANTVILGSFTEPPSLTKQLLLADGGVVTQKGNVRLQLFRGARPTFGPGTYDLACSPGVSCQGSVLFDRWTGQTYGVESGTLTVSAATTPVSNELAGAISKLVFRRLTGVGILDPGGACFVLPAAAFDTRVPAGTPCSQPEDCGSSNKACDPKTLTCSPSLCGAFGAGACVTGEICLGAGGYNGLDPQGMACFPECAPFASTCGAGTTCRPRSSSTGVCLKASAAQRALGEPCSVASLVNECASGLTCDGVCKKACNHLAANPGCSPAERCLSSDVCGTVPTASPAAVDSPCSLPANTVSVPCGDDGATYRGVCASAINAFGGTPPPPKCHRLCDPTAPACPTGFCSYFGPTPDSVCKQ